MILFVLHSQSHFKRFFYLLKITHRTFFFKIANWFAVNNCVFSESLTLSVSHRRDLFDILAYKSRIDLTFYKIIFYPQYRLRTLKNYFESHCRLSLFFCLYIILYVYCFVCLLISFSLCLLFWLSVFSFLLPLRSYGAVCPCYIYRNTTTSLHSSFNPFRSGGVVKSIPPLDT